MNISLNYKDKETTIKMPENYNELLTQFQNAYSLNESIMKKILYQVMKICLFLLLPVTKVQL